ncbi:metallophosphoesterase [Bradyrhizobium sp. CCGUVB23]|uniref:metallophosphoesterase family protein n=1 Tax=Bradyrhizobium sp. CCGUVB23 TaxID=2949630 RepID=UPI0020B1E696|nr:metallophosphoesterase [Bradyrhizobium sp. CCGUVB23]MCP3464543.1 metallophosphoesterase [Bradyrhizobium sp. CCGUVB23]
MTRTRLAIISDIHHGRDTLSKKGSAALPLLERFISDVDKGDFSAVIDLGDRISDESSARDRELQADVARLFQAVRIPRYHVSGNHDHAMLSAAENEAILGAPTSSRSQLVGDVRIVFWQPDVSLTLERGFHLAPGDLRELSDILEADDRPTLLVSHVPLSGHAQIGNYYFENNPGHSTYAEIADIRRVIAAAPCPIVALAGHVHWNTVSTVDATPHITLQSLTESFTTAGEPAGTTAVLEIEGDVLTWTVGGRDPFAVTLPWRHAKSKWTAPLPDFATIVNQVRR